MDASKLAPEGMEKDLSASVNRIRSNKMSFANEGMELSVNIPDTYDVQDTFNTMVKTVVAQQDLILVLQGKLLNAIEDAANTKKELKSSITALNEAQQTMQRHIANSDNKIKNIANNIQGFDDGKSEPGSSGQMNLASQSNIYLTDLSGNKQQVELVKGQGKQITWGGAVKGIGIRNFSTMTKAQRLSFYREVPLFNCPKENKHRWKWAIKKVLLRNRMNRQRVGVTRMKVQKGTSLFEKINFLEHEAIAIPNRISKIFNALLEKLTAKVNDDMAQLAEKQSNDKLELLKLCQGLNKSIENMGKTLGSFGEDLTALKAAFKKEEEKRQALGDRVHKADSARLQRKFDYFTMKCAELFEILRTLDFATKKLLVKDMTELNAFELGTLYKQCQEVRLVTMEYVRIKAITESLIDGCNEVDLYIKDTEHLLSSSEKTVYGGITARISTVNMNVGSTLEEATNAIENLQKYEKYVFTKMELMMNDNSAIDAIKQATKEISKLQRQDEAFERDIERLNMTVYNVQTDLVQKTTVEEVTTIAQQVINQQPKEDNISPERLQREINAHVDAIVKNLIETHLSKMGKGGGGSRG